jgi:hypothetical protein
MKNEENKGKMQFLECFLLNAMKNEERKNAIFGMFLVECDEKGRK